jgi:hypothetical protein
MLQGIEALNKIRSVVPRSLEEVERIFAGCLAVYRHNEISQSACAVHHLATGQVVCFCYVGI